MVNSAGEHEWRSAKVLLFPSRSGTTITLHVRRHRGADLVWERRIGHVHLPHLPDGRWRTIAEALRAAGDCLHSAADRLDDRS